MLMMTGVGPLARAENDALHMLNVPTASISMTVLKPFGDSLEAGARKFPAAQFTKMSNFPKVSRHCVTAASPSCRVNVSTVAHCIQNSTCKNRET